MAATSSISAEKPLDPNAPAEVPIPLQNSWTIWHDFFQGRGVSFQDFEANLKLLCKFNTVQSFWEYFNNLPTPKDIPQKSSMHLMLEGVKPLWEDPRNATGGFWAWRIYKSDTAAVWNDLVLAAIGDQFQQYLQDNDEVNGVTVSIRLSDDIVQVWNRDASEEAQQKLLKRIKQVVPNLRSIASYYKPCQEHQSFVGDKAPAKK